MSGNYENTCTCGDPTFEPHHHSYNFKKTAEFALPFAYTMVKLKKALDAGEGVTLTHEELSIVIDALKLLSSGVKKEKI